MDALLIRDFLKLVSLTDLRKKQYKDMIELVSTVLTYRIRDCDDSYLEKIPKEEMDDEDLTFQVYTREMSREKLAEEEERLLKRYLELVKRFLEPYLDRNVSHLVIDGGETYRNWEIHQSEDSLEIRLIVNNFEEINKKILGYVRAKLLYPLKILFVENKSITNRSPRYYK